MKTVEYEIRDIIAQVLTRLGDKYASEDAINLVYRTGMVETGYEHLEQDKGPALGFFQVEPDTIHSVLDNYISFRPELRQKLTDFGFDWSDPEFSVLTNIAIQIVFCRLKYWRIPEPLPSSLFGQAKYWKQYYNTPQGKGTVDKFVKANGG